MTGLPSADDYEALVESIMSSLAATSGVTTDLLERPKDRLPGATGTTHQIDLLWDFTENDGSAWRVLFEARSYATRLKQSAVFAFDGVVQDIAEVNSRQCVGVMVTTTGYQRGAKLVGDSRDVMLLELRKPGEKDLEGRINRICVTATARRPFIDNVQVQLNDRHTGPSVQGLVDVEMPDGTRLPIDQILLSGELSSVEQPLTPRHRVERTFARGTRLLCDDEDIGELHAIVAEVGETETDFSFTVGGREKLAWLLKDSTGARRVWFADDGHHWTTD